MRWFYSFYKLFYNSLARLNNVLAAAENLEGADVDILKGELYAIAPCIISI